MQKDEVVAFLEASKNELSGIIGRFRTNHGGIHIEQTDDARIREIVLDLKGFFQDEFINHREYVVPLVGYFQQGTQYGSVSYQCVESFRGVVSSALARVKRNPAVLKDGDSAAIRALRAYEGLDLHPEIARAASSLYRDGHYSQAVETSVKALNALVRLRSGLEHDGTTLMERAFNPTNPIMKFNDLQSQSDKDEQKGFMQLFCGAVSGLRNPRAHSFLEDSPERALEFIAFVSLLGKLLDKATP